MSSSMPNKLRTKDKLKRLWVFPMQVNEGTTASQSNTVNQSNVKEGFEIAGRVAQTLLKKLPECIDGNPVKMALSIVKAVIDMYNSIQDTKGTLEERLQTTKVLLADITEMMGASDPDDIKQEMDIYRTILDEEIKKLETATEEFKAYTRKLDYENYMKSVEGICKCIQEATEKFKFTLLVNIGKRTARMHNDMKKASLKDLNPSSMADHKSILEGRKACTVGTRIGVLKQITDWANDSSPDSPRVFWLTGQGGLGKTTIAYTIAQQFETDQPTALGANFLCSRQYPETRALKCILPTIAYQLAHSCAPFEAALHDQVSDKSATINHNVSHQIDELLVRPWRKTVLPLPQTYLVVIDALDEIEQINGTDGSTLLRDLLTTVGANVTDFLGLKFLVTSRPDSTISKLIAGFPFKAICQLQTMVPEEVTLDIKTYLEFKLPDILDSPELVKLRERAGGLFIYAATAVKILHGISSEEQIEILRIFLSETSNFSSISDDTSPIDELYQHVLHRAFAKIRKPLLQRRLDVLYSFLCSAERISPVIAASLTESTEGIAAEVVEALHAVLYIQGGRVFWYHASFPDFMFSQSRSNFRLDNRDFSFFCDEAIQHRRLALSCFRIMKSDLRFNIGGIASSFELDRDHHDELSTRINHNISPGLRYSCNHWAHHLVSVLPNTAVFLTAVDTGFRLVSDFLQVRVLFWIEAMNLLGTSNQCTPMLLRVRQWTLEPQAHKNTDLARDLLEAANFATRFTASPAAQSTPHLYISTLATWQQESSLSMNWRNNFSRIPVFTWQNKLKSYTLLMTVTFASPSCAVAFSPDGTKLVSGLEDGSIRVLDTSSGAQVNELKGHTYKVNSVMFSYDGTRVVSGSYDKTIRVWNATTGAQLLELTGDHPVSSVQFSHDGALVVSGSDNGSLRTWNSFTGIQQLELSGHTDRVTSVAFSHDGTQIVSGSYDMSVRIWDASIGEQLCEIAGHRSVVSSVAFSPDSSRVVFGLHDTSVRVCAALTGEQLFKLEGHARQVESVAFSPDGARIVSGSYDNHLRVWDVITGVQLNALIGHSGPVYSVTFSPDGTRIMSGSSDGTVRLWDASQGMQLNESKGHGNRINSVAFSHDGKRIVSGSSDNSVRVWDAYTGAEQHELRGHNDWVKSVAFSPDGTRIVSGSDDVDVIIWDALQGTPLHQLKDHGTWVNSVAFSHDGTRIVSGSDDYTLRVWDSSGGKQLLKLEDHHWSWDKVNDLSLGKVKSVAFSRDGTRIVSGSNNHYLRLWDAVTGNIVGDLNGHSGRVISVAYSYDGTRIVSGSDDMSVRVWDAAKGVQLNMLNGHHGLVNSVAFSSDGTQIVSASNDCSVKVWSTSTGELLSELKTHDSRAFSAAFSPDGSRVVSGWGDTIVRVWTLNTSPATWYLAADRWTRSLLGNNRLIWAPPEILLKQANISTLIARQTSAYVDFDLTKLGLGWQECYTPCA